MTVEEGRSVIVVSGLPRSGTSMMMQMLEAGGVEALTDLIRTPDEDNLKGYYEWERVKGLPEDSAWLKEAGGKAVKIISQLLVHLPATYAYRVIFMRRDLREILASQRQMLLRRGVAEAVDDDRMAGVFRKHIQEMEAYLAGQTNVRTLYADYEDILKHPAAWSERIGDFLGRVMPVERMAGVVDAVLHRQRKGA